jgi:hypothetical protein
VGGGFEDGLSLGGLGGGDWRRKKVLTVIGLKLMTDEGRKYHCGEEVELGLKDFAALDKRDAGMDTFIRMG